MIGRSQWIRAAIGTVLAVGLVAGLGWFSLEFRRMRIQVRYVAELLEDASMESLSPTEAAFDVRSALVADDIVELRRERTRLREIIWPEGYPQARRADATQRLTDFLHLGRHPEVAGFLGMTIEHSDGLVTRPVLVEHREADCLTIYHGGHGNLVEQRPAHLEFFLDLGCDVLAVDMPLLGMNPPLEWIVGGERTTLETHDDLRAVNSQATLLQLFLEPTIVGMNEALALRGDRYRLVSMVGLSGGGWTTTLVGAVEDRIDVLAPVAGSFPMHLRRLHPPSMGDYEQWLPDLYNRYDYVSLYLLGSAAPSSRQVLIYNMYDPCCFPGAKTAAFSEQLESVAEQWGLGDLSVIVDVSHRDHDISPEALAIIGETMFGTDWRNRLSGLSRDAIFSK